MGLSGEFFGVIVGAILAGVIGIVIVCFTKYLEKRTNKKYTSRALLLEVEANQNRIQESNTIIGSLDEECDIGDFQLPKSIIFFDRTVYSALSDKIGSLDSKGREKVVQYYVKIKFMEDRLRVIHEIPPSTHTDFSEDLIQLIKTDAKEAYLKDAKEAYIIGEELVERLKEQI